MKEMTWTPQPMSWSDFALPAQNMEASVIGENWNYFNQAQLLDSFL